MSLLQSAVRIASGAFRQHITGSPTTTRILFGVSCAPREAEDHYFDLTTPVLAQRALRDITSHTRVLDLGTGPAAILGLTFWQRTGCQVIASDVDANIVRLAEKNVARNRAPIRVLQSNFFEAIDSPFDLVTFNAPYVASLEGVARRASQQRRSQWDGGPDGTAVISLFLQQLARLKHPVDVFLGINGLHVHRQQVRHLIAQYPDLWLREIYRPLILPIDTYVLRKSS